MSGNHKRFEEKGEPTESSRGPSAYQPNALLLGQTGSQALPLTAACDTSRKEQERGGAVDGSMEESQTTLEWRGLDIR